MSDSNDMLVKAYYYYFITFVNLKCHWHSNSLLLLMNKNDFIRISSKVISFHVIKLSKTTVNSSTSHSFLLCAVRQSTLQTDSDNTGFRI